MLLPPPQAFTALLWSLSVGYAYLRMQSLVTLSPNPSSLTLFSIGRLCGSQRTTSLVEWCCSCSFHFYFKHVGSSSSLTIWHWQSCIFTNLLRYLESCFTIWKVNFLERRKDLLVHLYVDYLWGECFLAHPLFKKETFPISVFSCALIRVRNN